MLNNNLMKILKIRLNKARKHNLIIKMQRKKQGKLEKLQNNGKNYQKLLKKDQIKTLQTIKMIKRKVFNKFKN